MITRSSLDALADAILTHLAENPDLFESLVSETGLMPADLKAMAGDASPAFATALVDFICGSDDRLTAFSQASGWPAAQVDGARQALEAGFLR